MTSLYDYSVPIFLRYLDQAEAIIGTVPEGSPVWSARLAPGMFTAREQFATAIEFTLRVACPLAGRPVPDLPDETPLREMIAAARRHLGELGREAFGGAGLIEHEAGFARLRQEPIDFLRHFGLPNFFFHLSMGFAILRQQGIDIGKADFDGLHAYPPGFQF